MAKVVAGVSMSLDGFMRGADGDLSLLYPDFEMLHQSEPLQESMRNTGAVVMGRNSYDMAEGDYTGYEYQVPIFVVTHNAPAQVAKGENDKLSFTFVTDGVESAVKQAKAAAGDKDVTIVGGANVIQKALEAGLIDELNIDIMPVLLHDGLRLFGTSDSDPIQLKKVRVYEYPNGGTNFSYQVLKG